MNPANLKITQLSVNGFNTCRRPMACTAFAANVNKAFLCWMGVGWIPSVAVYDYQRREMKIREAAVSNPAADIGKGDNHHYPTLVLDTQGHIHLFYGCHDENPVCHAKSPKPYSIDGKWEVAYIKMARFACYPMPIVSESGEIFVFYRERMSRMGDYPIDYRPLAYVRSTDGGETWEEKVTCIDNYNRPDNLNEIYTGRFRSQKAENGRAEQFHVAWTISGGGYEKPTHDRHHKNLYYATFCPENRHFYDVNDNDLGTVINQEESENNCKVLNTGDLKRREGSKHIDISYSPLTDFTDDGNILISYFHKGTIGISRFADNKWISESICSSVNRDAPYDMVKTGPQDFTVYVDEDWQIRTYHTADDGATWSKGELVKTPLPVAKATVVRDKTVKNILATEYIKPIGNSETRIRRVHFVQE